MISQVSEGGDRTKAVFLNGSFYLALMASYRTDCLSTIHTRSTANDDSNVATETELRVNVEAGARPASWPWLRNGEPSLAIT